MGATLKFCTALVKRLGAVDPTVWQYATEETKGAYRDTLMEVAVSDEHAKAIVDTWLREGEKLPTPSQLRAIASSTEPARPGRSADSCPVCRGSGRESYWALITTERWSDSGKVKRRYVERIPPNPGSDPAFYLSERPAIEAKVDGQSQIVALLSGYCLCEYGQHMQTIQRPVMKAIERTFA